MVVVFNYDRGLFRRELVNEKKRIEALLNRQIVQQVEQTVRTWCKQMERVICIYFVFLSL